MSAQQKKWRRVFFSQWFLLVNIIVLSLVTYTTARSFYYHYQVQKEIRQFQERARSMETKNMATTELLTYITSKDYIEKRARTELNLMKPGEQVVLVHTSSSTNGNRQTDQPMVKKQHLSNPERWWKYFFEHYY